MNQEISELYCKDLTTRPVPGLGKILVTGATGYIGGRLVPELIDRGYEVRAMVRRAAEGDNAQWPGAEIGTADALNIDSLQKIMEGVHTAYYLIHSLLLGPREFESVDVQAAINFRRAAERMKVKRIVYLGGLGDKKTSLSPHLRSRIQVAQELQKGGVPVTILRAAIIIGSGSASYEILEHSIRNAPVLLIPFWARTLCQPIAVRDVVKYLVGVLEEPATSGMSYDIGGNDILSYEMMLRMFADILGKKRLFLKIPSSNIGILSYLVSLITPVPHPIARCLMESSFHEVVCMNGEIKRLLPFEPLSLREAFVRALSREEQDRVSTRWSNAYPPAFELSIKLRELVPPPRYTTCYSLMTDKKATALYSSLCMIGGKEGWFNTNWMWKIRGWVDRILLGVGTLRGRRSSTTLRVNDVIDFWRVEDLKQDERLLLRAEMKLPGKAWLQFSIDDRGEKRRLSVTAFYGAESLAAKAYWYSFLPFHHFIFRDLIFQIEKRS